MAKETNGRNNGIIIKALLGAAGIALTVGITLLASGRNQGRQEEKVLQAEKMTASHAALLSHHDREITTLKTKWDSIDRRLTEQTKVLHDIRERLPARP